MISAWVFFVVNAQHCPCFHLLQPLTAITEALDGAGKVYELKSFSDAKIDYNREVRQAADHVYSLLVDLPSLFSRRQRIAFAKARQLDSAPTMIGWADYLVRRLPVTIDARKLHALYRPEGIASKVYYDDNASVAPSVAASATPSTLALSRLRDSKLDAHHGYQDEEERLFGPRSGQVLDESIEEEEFLPQTGMVPSQTWSRNPKPIEASVSSQNDELVSAEDLFAEDEPLLTRDALTYASGTSDMLASFNYAISSHGGSAISVSQTGSLFDGSERSGDGGSSLMLSERDYGRDGKMFAPRMGRISEAARRFSYSDVDGSERSGEREDSLVTSERESVPRFGGRVRRFSYSDLEQSNRSMQNTVGGEDRESEYSDVEPLLT